LRFFRLYPLHIALLVVLVVLEIGKVIGVSSGAMKPGVQLPFTGTNSYETLVANIFLLQGLPVVDTISWNTPSWSISCEAVTYPVFGLLVMTGVTRKRSFFVIGTLFAVAAYSALAVFWGTLNLTYDLGVVRCLAGFFLGMLVFVFVSSAWGKKLSAQSTRLINTFELAIVAALVLTMSLAFDFVDFLILPIFVGVVAVFQLDRGFIAKLLMSRPIQFLGRVSYSVYMIHAVMWFILAIGLRRLLEIPVSVDPVVNAPVFQVSPWVGDALVIGLIAAVIATSTFTYSFIEAPARAYGRRLLASSTKQINVGLVLPQDPNPESQFKAGR
jgi:peptidoglycan/LPS O-acetylase OafA/YrhL